MDHKNHGKTWFYQKRERFAGLDITPKNNKIVKRMFMEDFISDNSYLVDSGEISEEELLKKAENYALEHIRYNKKMREAHNKGKTHFMFNGRVEPVRTVEMLERFKKSLDEIQQKYNKIAEENEQRIESSVEGV